MLSEAATAQSSGHLSARSVMNEPYIGQRVDTGLKLQECNKMRSTGDRCCVARGTEIIFEGTEAECREFAEKEAKDNTGFRVSIYAPLAVVTSRSSFEVKVETRQVMRVRK